MSMSLPVRRSAISNLAVGVFVGALATASSVAAILVFLAVGMLLFVVTPTANWIATAYIIVQSIAAILLASLLGAVIGFLIAIIDNLVDGRMHDGRMPFWAWLPIGGVMGTAGSVPTLVVPPGTTVSTSAIAFYAIIGAFCGLIAGPLFGLLYRRRTKDGLEVAQGQTAQLADYRATNE